MGGKHRVFERSKSELFRFGFGFNFGVGVRLCSLGCCYSWLVVDRFGARRGGCNAAGRWFVWCLSGFVWVVRYGEMLRRAAVRGWSNCRFMGSLCREVAVTEWIQLLPLLAIA
ncbi:hypothetical protein Droror1_Dr00008745 [Drosera rotundifolia]